MIEVNENGWRWNAAESRVPRSVLPRDTTPSGTTGAVCPAGEAVYGCTEYAGHRGPHRAGDGTHLVAVWAR